MSFQFPILGSRGFAGLLTSSVDNLSIPYIGFFGLVFGILVLVVVPFNSLYWVLSQRYQNLQKRNITFNSLYWVHILCSPFLTNILPPPFNSLYWVLESVGKPIDENKINFQFPILGSWESTSQQHRLERTSFNSLYWVRCICINIQSISKHFQFPILGS